MKKSKYKLGTTREIRHGGEEICSTCNKAVEDTCGCNKDTRKTFFIGQRVILKGYNPKNLAASRRKLYKHTEESRKELKKAKKEWAKRY